MPSINHRLFGIGGWVLLLVASCLVTLTCQQPATQKHSKGRPDALDIPEDWRQRLFDLVLIAKTPQDYSSDDATASTRSSATFPAAAVRAAAAPRASIKPAANVITPRTQPAGLPAGGATGSLDWTRLPTYAEYSLFLRLQQDGSEGVCNLTSIGTSVKGRQLWVVRVTLPEGEGPPYRPDPDHPDVDYPKPHFAYIGNMHGDETGNLMVLLRLVELLCTGSKLDPRIFQLLARTVIYIAPSINPDGYTLRTRSNANNVDLNRNCLTPDFPYAPPDLVTATAKASYSGYPLYPTAVNWALTGSAPKQPEVLAVMRWLREVRPAVSTNLHGGALVANYALDSCDSLGVVTDCPSLEDPMPNFLANVYAMNHPEMVAAQYDSFGDGIFINGTTQGARWYTVIGSLQDWITHALHLQHITLELHTKKNPPPGQQLSRLFPLNLPSLLRLAEMAHLGWQARVFDAVTNKPLAANATVLSPAGFWDAVGSSPAAAAAAAGAGDGSGPRVSSTSASASNYRLFKVLIPNVLYKMQVQAYDPGDPRVRYLPIEVEVKVVKGWDDVVHGSGLAGLTAVNTLWAIQEQLLPPSDDPTRRKLAGRRLQAAART